MIRRSSSSRRDRKGELELCCCACFGITLFLLLGEILMLIMRGSLRRMIVRHAVLVFLLCSSNDVIACSLV